ncbi:MAG: envelope stress response membrane protein PspC [Rhodospirillaceae bacterium]
MSRQRRKFYLDKQNGKIFGVCAGIADYFDWDVTIVRVLCVAGTIIAGGWPIVVYLVAAWMIENKPAGGTYEEMRASIDDTRREAEYRRPAGAWRFTDVKSRFDRVENRLRTLENVVTSREFQMDRELRGLGRV